MKRGENMVASNLRAERARKGWTQAELAAKANLSRISIANYESGSSEPGATALNSLADALNVTTDKLLGRDD